MQNLSKADKEVLADALQRKTTIMSG